MAKVLFSGVLDVKAPEDPPSGQPPNWANNDEVDDEDLNFLLREDSDGTMATPSPMALARKRQTNFMDNAVAAQPLVAGGSFRRSTRSQSIAHTMYRAGGERGEKLKESLAKMCSIDTAPDEVCPSPTHSITDYSESQQSYAQRGDTDWQGILPKVWDIFEQKKGYLTYDDVDDLLFFLGVEMETCLEIEFYHKIDRKHEGNIYFHPFSKHFFEFIKTKKFSTSPVLCILCAVAAHLGLTSDAVSDAWRGKAQNLEEHLGISDLMAIFASLDLQVSYSCVSELLHVMGEEKADGIKYLSFTEYMGLFTNCLQTDEELRHKLWIEEIKHIIGRRGKRSVYCSAEQIFAQRCDEWNDWYTTVFQWVLFLYAQLNIVVPIFLLCFQDPSLSFSIGNARLLLRVFLLLSDIIMWVNMWFKIMILPQEKDGAPVYDPTERRWTYFKSKAFRVDLLVVLPLDILVAPFFTSGLLHPFFRLNKLLLVGAAHAQFQILLAPVFGQKWWRIVNALYWWAMLGHCVGCVFNCIALSAGDKETFVVLTIHNYSTLDETNRYLQSLSFAINTMAGLSRGYFPNHDGMALFALIVVILGVFVYALLLAVVALGLSITGPEEKLHSFIDEVKDVFSPDVRANRLPKHFVKEIVNYHKHVFYSTGQLNLQEDILKDLPQEVRMGLDLIFGKQTIGRVAILECISDNDEIIYALQQCLTLVVYPPGSTVIQSGDTGCEMYFIWSGSCVVIDDDDERAASLGPGDLFGEIALLTSVSRTATIRSETFCNLLVLSAEDFNMVTALHPGLFQKIQEQARARIRYIKENRIKKREMSLLGDSVSRSVASHPAPTPVPENSNRDPSESSHREEREDSFTLNGSSAHKSMQGSAHASHRENNTDHDFDSSSHENSKDGSEGTHGTETAITKEHTRDRDTITREHTRDRDISTREHTRDRDTITREHTRDRDTSTREHTRDRDTLAREHTDLLEPPEMFMSSGSPLGGVPARVGSSSLLTNPLSPMKPDGDGSEILVNKASNYSLTLQGVNKPPSFSTHLESMHFATSQRMSGTGDLGVPFHMSLNVGTLLPDNQEESSEESNGDEDMLDWMKRNDQNSSQIKPRTGTSRQLRKQKSSYSRAGRDPPQ